MKGRKKPSFDEACGAVMARTTVLQAEKSAPVAQLIGPRAAGAQPVKSAWIVSSPTVTATSMWIGSSEWPSPSMKPVARYTPFGILRISARAICSPWSRIRSNVPSTTSTP